MKTSDYIKTIKVTVLDNKAKLSKVCYVPCPDGTILAQPIEVEMPTEEAAKIMLSGPEALDILVGIYTDPKIKLLTHATEVQNILIKAGLI